MAQKKTYWEMQKSFWKTPPGVIIWFAMLLAIFAGGILALNFLGSPFPVIEFFNAESRFLEPGQSSNLSWSVVGASLVEIDQAEPMVDLLTKAKPFTAQKMAPDLPVEDYVEAFLGAFSLDMGQSGLWQDQAGGRVVISDELFRNAAGGWKGAKRGHGDHAALLAEALRDPDEIWLGVREVPIEGFPDEFELQLTRRYIRIDPETALFTMFEVGRRNWQAVTGYASYNRAKPDYSHIGKQRVGKLIWKRK